MATLQQYAVLGVTGDCINTLVTLDDGSTFGQLVYGVSTVAELDAAINAAVARVTAAQPATDPILQAGLVRTSSAIPAAI